MVLNFGHTIGHAVETLTKYRGYNHGEAVAIGMVTEAVLANSLRMLEKAEVTRITDLLEKIGLPTVINSFAVAKIIKTLAIDKKVRRGRIQFVLPRKIGKVEIKSNVPLKAVKKVLREMGCK